MTSQGYTLAVDVGPTTTMAATAAAGAAPVVLRLSDDGDALPTTVLVPEEGQLVVGEAAERASAQAARSVLRGFTNEVSGRLAMRVGRRWIHAHDLMAAVVAEALERAVEHHGRAPDRLVLTTPGAWGRRHSGLLLSAVEAAASPPAVVVPSALAAAHHHVHRHGMPVGSLLAVLDVGGGSADVSVLRQGRRDLGVTAVPTSAELPDGAALTAPGSSPTGRSVPTDAAEGDAQRLHVDVLDVAASARGDTTTVRFAPSRGRAWEWEVPVARVAAVAAVAVERAVATLREGLRTAGIAPDELERVLLVGRGAQHVLLARRVGDELGIPVVVPDAPGAAACLGAAIPAPGNGVPSVATLPSLFASVGTGATTGRATSRAPSAAPGPGGDAAAGRSTRTGDPTPRDGATSDDATSEASEQVVLPDAGPDRDTRDASHRRTAAAPTAARGPRTGRPTGGVGGGGAKARPAERTPARDSTSTGRTARPTPATDRSPAPGRDRARTRALPDGRTSAPAQEDAPGRTPATLTAPATDEPAPATAGPVRQDVTPSRVTTSPTTRHAREDAPDDEGARSDEPRTVIALDDLPEEHAPAVGDHRAPAQHAHPPADEADRGDDDALAATAGPDLEEPTGSTEDRRPALLVVAAAVLVVVAGIGTALTLSNQRMSAPAVGEGFSEATEIAPSPSAGAVPSAAAELLARTGPVAVLDEEAGRIVVRDVDGDRDLSGDLVAPAGPALAPDGTQVLFTADGTERRRLYLAPTDGSAPPVALETGIGLVEDPAWSPDGTRVVFSHRLGPVRTIRMLDLGTDALVDLTAGAVDDRAPAWSPDGSWLAFHREPTDGVGEAQVLVMPADVSDAPRQVVDVQLDPWRDPAWSPDGTRLAVTTGDVVAFGTVLVVDVATGRSEPLAPQVRTPLASPSWSGAGVVLVEQHGDEVTTLAVDPDDGRVVHLGPGREPAVALVEDAAG